MPADPSLQLTRPTRHWSQVANAGGFALRYVEAIYQGFGAIARDEPEAREMLAYLISRLAQKGFGDHASGRLADYLRRVTWRVAKAYVRKLHPDRPELPETEDPQWVTKWQSYWAENLLTRAWRSLERYEHRHRTSPLFTILQTALAHPNESADALAVRLSAEAGVTIASAELPRAIAIARRRLAQHLVDEVAETLNEPDLADALAEVSRLQLNPWVSPFVTHA